MNQPMDKKFDIKAVLSKYPGVLSNIGLTEFQILSDQTFYQAYCLNMFDFCWTFRENVRLCNKSDEFQVKWHFLLTF